MQEEPQNQGAWYRLRAYLRADTPDVDGARLRRPRISASPAVGYATKHLSLGTPVSRKDRAWRFSS